MERNRLCKFQKVLKARDIVMLALHLPFQVTIRSLPQIDLEVAEAGTSGNPLVILLHGFPDSWPTWQLQMKASSRAGTEF